MQHTCAAAEPPCCVHPAWHPLPQVKESVERLTSNVQDGSLQRLSQQLADTRAAPLRRRPYSMLLAQVCVRAWMGVVVACARLCGGCAVCARAAASVQLSWP